MPKFSKKINIKIGNKKSIYKKIEDLNNNYKMNNTHKSEIYFIDNKVEIDKIDKFENLENFVLIENDENKKSVILYNEDKKYVTKLDDIITTIQILYALGYTMIFSIKYDIYSFLIDGINTYIYYINDENCYLSFNESIDEVNAKKVIDKLEKNNITINDTCQYYSIIEEEFNKLKKK